MTKKSFVLDTSALILSPYLMFRLEEECEIFIPEVVVRELRGLMRSTDLRVAEAAETVINALRFYSGHLAIGVVLPTGATLRTYSAYERINDLAKDADNKVIGAAISLMRENGDEVIVLTTDTYMRIIARAYNLIAKFPCFESTSAGEVLV